MIKEEYLTPDQVASILGVTLHTLQIWRKEKTFPKLRSIKMGRLVRYKRSVIDEFMTECEQ